MTTRKMPNEKLVDRLAQAKEDSKISYNVLSDLIQTKPSIASKYCKKKRGLTGEVLIKKAKIAVIMLEDMIKQKILPISEPPTSPKYAAMLTEVIDAYLVTAEQKIKDGSFEEELKKLNKDVM